MSQEPVQEGVTDAQRAQKIKDFMTLLPLTREIAGLPQGEIGRNFNEGQMDVRNSTLKLAYKMARQLLKDISS
ncbi:MAG: hypothetical protein EXR99_07355 [Gemmataceae bacterium]|nr:hypothetical protein [Gemmataceae bacterium]